MTVPEERLQEPDCPECHAKDGGARQGINHTSGCHTAIGEPPLQLSPAYILIRRRGGWSISCAHCGGYNVHWNPTNVDTIEDILGLHYCGDVPF